MARSEREDDGSDRTVQPEQHAVPTAHLDEARAVRDQIEALPEVLTPAEAAIVLRMSEGALLRLCRSDPEVPARRVAGNWRFSKSALLSWVSDGRDAGTPLRTYID